DAQAEVRIDARPVPEARRRADVRSPYRSLVLQYEPRRGPAASPDAQGPGDPGEGEPGEIRRAGEPLLPGRRLRVGRPRYQAAPADQRAELRALQDLRHQGPAAEHRLGRARGRRRTQLPEHVAHASAILQ